MYTNGQIQAAVFSIQKGLPIPEQRHGNEAKYPLRMMEVGDSFAVPVAKEKLGAMATALKSKGAKIAGRKFTTRRLVEDGKHVVRIWRTA